MQFCRSHFTVASWGFANHMVIRSTHSEEMMEALYTFKGKKTKQAVVWKIACSANMTIPGKSSHCICCLWLLIVCGDVQQYTNKVWMCHPDSVELKVTSATSFSAAFMQAEVKIPKSKSCTPCT